MSVNVSRNAITSRFSLFVMENPCTDGALFGLSRPARKCTSYFFS